MQETRRKGRSSPQSGDHLSRMETILIWSQLSRRKIHLFEYEDHLNLYRVSSPEEVTTSPRMEAILIWSQFSGRSVYLTEYGGHLSLDSALHKKFPPLNLESAPSS